MRILIIENDISLNKILHGALKEHGYSCDVVESLKEGKYYLDIRNYNLTLVNETLLNGNSADDIQEIKTNLPKTALIVMADKQDNQSEIEALRAGADDYISKPFDVDVLLARILARLGLNGNRLIQIDGLTINLDEERVNYQEQAIDLRGKPFEVLAHLAQYRNQIISREQLLHALWIDPEFVTPQVIEVAINQIRQKIDKPFGITTIEPVRRRGYRFVFPKELS